MDIVAFMTPLVVLFTIGAFLGIAVGFVRDALMGAVEGDGGSSYD